MSEACGRPARALADCYRIERELGQGGSPAGLINHVGLNAIAPEPR